MSVDVIARWEQEHLPAALADAEALAAQVDQARAARDEAQRTLDELERRHAYAAHMATALQDAAAAGRHLLEPSPPAEALASVGLKGAIVPSPPVDPRPDDLTAPGVIDSREQVAALTGGHPIVPPDAVSNVPRGPNGRAIPPPGPIEFVPDDPSRGEDGTVLPPDSPGTVVATGGPLMTMPDTGLAPPRLDPAPAAGRPRHEKPRDSTGTGGFRRIAERAGLVTPQATDQDGDA